MSLILEALRRSEAERRRGVAPDLLTPVAAARPASARALPAIAIWTGLATLTVLAIGAALAWQLRGTPAAPEPVAAGEEAVALEAEAARLPSPAMSERRMPAQRVPAVATPPVAASTPPASRAPTPGTTPAALPASTPADVAHAPTAPSAAPPTPANPGGVATSTPPAAPSSSGVAVAPATSTATSTAPASSGEFISPEATLRLSDLSAEERGQLPALKVSMHMWAPDAAHRFVIIDGTRLTEGDRVADATVSAIQSDGVTLAWRGRRIRLPIR